MPMAVLEAMASALPVLATRAGGLPDLVSEGVNGLLVEPGQPQQLAAALNRILDDEPARFAMAQQSYRTARDCYSIEQHVDKLLSAYQATVARA
jgi:glycosyltransferase involved in cell wall biosynthesis